jgi:hypothetical protein
MRKRNVLAGLATCLGVAVIAVVAFLPAAGAAGQGNQGSLAELSSAYQGTAAFTDVRKAVAAGYRPSDFPAVAGKGECFDSSAGGMGIHYLKAGLLGDGKADPARPEALVYQPGAGGKLKLVALEYVVFKSNLPGTRPSLFGQRFASNDGAALGIPPFYALHAWAWKQNPSGLFSDWNPTVSCRFPKAS